MRSWPGWFVIVLATVMYAYAVWSAVGNIILFPDFAAAIGLSVSTIGWVWLSIQVALPFVVAAGALMLGRKRPVVIRALILLAGVALVSVLSIDIMHSIPQSSYFG